MVAALLVTLIALSACAPAADWLRDRLDTGGGATLDYVTGGVAFDPGPATAYQVHITLRGEGIVAGDNGPLECEVTSEGRYMDCSLGTVSSVVTIRLSGSSVIGSATYTREPAGLAWEWAYTPVSPALQ